MLSYRRDGSYTKEDARCLWNAIEKERRICETVSDFISVMTGYGPCPDDCWEMVGRVRNPQAAGFWERIWLPLMEHVRRL